MSTHFGTEVCEVDCKRAPWGLGPLGWMWCVH